MGKKRRKEMMRRTKSKGKVAESVKTDVFGKESEQSTGSNSINDSPVNTASVVLPIRRLSHDVLPRKPKVSATSAREIPRNFTASGHSKSNGSLVLPVRKVCQNFRTNEMSNSHPNVIVDVDAGVDDALALLLLLVADNKKLIKILGITCTHGNTSVDNVCINVLRLLGTLGRFDIPVYQGVEEPLISRHNKCSEDVEHFHGLDGFGDLTFPHVPSKKLIQPENAVSALNRMASEHKMIGKVTLICLAPLTNIALAMKVYPQFLNNLNDIFIMGGNSTGRGNITSAGEFNFYSDPEAAHIVLTSARCPIFMLPWETCLYTDISFDWRFNVLGKIQNSHMDLLNAIERKVWKKSNFSSWYPCDAILAAVFLHPDIVTKSRQCHVCVELQGTHTRGQVVLDHLEIKEPNVLLIENVDCVLLKKMLLWAAGHRNSGFEPEK